MRIVKVLGGTWWFSQRIGSCALYAHDQAVDITRVRHENEALKESSVRLSSDLDALTARVDAGANLTATSGVLSIPIIAQRLQEAEGEISQLQEERVSSSTYASEIVQGLKTRLCDLERKVFGYCRG